MATISEKEAREFEAMVLAKLPDLPIDSVRRIRKACRSNLSNRGWDKRIAKMSPERVEEMLALLAEAKARLKSAA